MKYLISVLGLVVAASVMMSAQAPGRAAKADTPVRVEPRMDSTSGPIPLSEWSSEDRALVEEFTVDGGQGADFRTFLNNPDAIKGVWPFYNYLSSDSSLDPEDREVLIMRTAWLTRNEYLWGHHNWNANKLGLTGPEIRRIAEGPDARGWDPFTATLLRAADELHHNAFISTATWNKLAERYGPGELLDAAFTVAEFTMLGGAFNSLGVRPEVIASGVGLTKLPDVPYQVTVPAREPALSMPRIKALEVSEWTPAQRALLDPNNTGRAIGLYRTFAHNTDLYKPRNTQSEQIRQHSTISAHARELLILRTAWLARCEYVWAQHVRQARTAGLDTARIPKGLEAPGWDPVDAALIKAADELFRDDKISDSTWKELSTHLTTPQMIDVLVTAGGYRATAMVGNSLGVAMEPEAERFPQ